MPELPEIETICRGLKPNLIHETIEHIVVRQEKLRVPVTHGLSAKIQNQKIIGITRRGKYIIIDLIQGALIIHLGMSGRLHLLSPDSPVKKHDHIDLGLSNKIILRYNDPRRFGVFLWVNEPLEHALIRSLGPEPLDKDFNGAYLYQKIKRSHSPIKALIMDHHLVVGVGNIYAAEALFLSKINPLARGLDLNLADCEKLATKIRLLLNQAIKEGGTTLKDFSNADAKPGYFQNKLKVYGRAGCICLICRHALISIIIRQRSTVYCPICQSMPMTSKKTQTQDP